MSSSGRTKQRKKNSVPLGNTAHSFVIREQSTNTSCCWGALACRSQNADWIFSTLGTSGGWQATCCSGSRPPKAGPAAAGTGIMWLLGKKNFRACPFCRCTCSPPALSSRRRAALAVLPLRASVYFSFYIYGTQALFGRSLLEDVLSYCRSHRSFRSSFHQPPIRVRNTVSTCLTLPSFLPSFLAFLPHSLNHPDSAAAWLCFGWVDG